MKLTDLILVLLRSALHLAIGLFLFGACVHKSRPIPPAPSVSGVKGSVQSAGEHVDRADAHAAQTGQHLEVIRSRSQRIDDKATVILQHWN